MTFNDSKVMLIFPVFPVYKKRMMAQFFQSIKKGEIPVFQVYKKGGES